MKTLPCLFVAGLLLSAPLPARAAMITVTLNTSGLPAGDYLLDFQFINGDALTGNNLTTISNFSSTNLTLGALSLFGTASGSDLMSGVMLIDGSMTEVDQAFTAMATAATISFVLSYSGNYTGPGPGDAFTFAITDTSLNSTRSTGNGAELEVDITGANPPVSVFPADAGSGGFTPTAVPEPSTGLLSACALLLLGLFAMWRKRPLFAAAGLAVLIVPAHAQVKMVGVPCGAPNAGGRTNLYGSGNPCAFTYSVPNAAQQIRLLRENRQCTMYSTTIVNCSKPVAGNYGQTRLLPHAQRAASGPPQYVVPSSPPPLGVPAPQRAEAERLWQQAAGLVDQNRYRDAMPLLFRAANMGHARAQSMLGIIFQDGDGVKANDRAAAYWFSAAAAQGHRAAQYALGGMYEEGEGGLPRNLAKATELYIKSAEQGFDKAQLVMGVQYELGEGVPRSRSKAIQLLRQAGGEGIELANVLENRSTPARFADAGALGNYLARLRNAQFAASWAKARASWGAGTGGGGSTLGEIMYRQWQARGGGGDPRNNGPPPTH